MADLLEPEIKRLITLYKEQENLYNFNLPAYHDRDKAKESCQYIAAMMGKGWDMKATKAKLKWLRNGYTRNAGVVKASKKSGASRDDVFKVRWRWFEDLEFLKSYCKLSTKGISNLPLSDTQQSQLNDSQLTDTQLDCDAEEEDPLEEMLQEPRSQHSTADADIHVLVERNRQEHCSTARALFGNSVQPSTPSGSQYGQPQPSTPSTSRIAPPPDFARLDRKRRAPSDSGPLCSVMADIAGSFKEKMERRKEKGSSNENAKFCSYLASQLDKMTPIAQLKVRKQIQDFVHDALLEEIENNNSYD